MICVMYSRPHSGLTLCDKYDRNEKVVFYLSYICITEFVLHIASAPEFSNMSHYHADTVRHVVFVSLCL